MLLISRPFGAQYKMSVRGAVILDYLGEDSFVLFRKDYHTNMSRFTTAGWVNGLDLFGGSGTALIACE